MTLLAKIITDLLCGILNSLGGHHWLFCRRYIMPFVVGLGVSLFSHTWWLGLTVLPAMGTLCLGYFGGAFWGRGLWLMLQAAVLGLFPMILGHLAWWLYIPYTGGALLLGGLLYNLEQVVGDAIFGAWLGLVAALVH